MFNHKFDTSNKSVIFQWFLLCFNAGYINAGGFLTAGRFVSHVTGFATLFGVDLASGNLRGAIGFLLVPFFFLLGSFLAGMLIDGPIHRNKKPHFDYVMGLSGFCLFLSAAFGELSLFGSYGRGPSELEEVYLLLSLLCLACGLQNGAVTSSSGNSIRTTHLTGLITDLGLGFARLVLFNRKYSKFPDEVRASVRRFASIAAFGLGSIAGGWFFFRLGYKGFIFPGLVSCYVAWHGRKDKITPHNNL